MNNKKYLLGLIIYAILYTVLVYTGTFELPSIVTSGFKILGLSLMLIPGLLTWVIACNLKNENYKVAIGWGLLFGAVIVFVAGVPSWWYFAPWTIWEALIRYLSRGLFCIVPLVALIAMVIRFSREQYKVAVWWAILFLVFVIPTGLSMYNFVFQKSHPARDARITAEMSQIPTEIEAVASKEGGYTPLGQDKGEGCDYNDTLRALCNDIDKQCLRKNGSCGGDDKDGGKEDVIIHANEENYCVYSPLNAKQGRWYCINSEGETLTTKINPSKYCNENSFECFSSE